MKGAGGLFCSAKCISPPATTTHSSSQTCQEYECPAGLSKIETESKVCEGAECSPSECCHGQVTTTAAPSTTTPPARTRAPLDLDCDLEPPCRIVGPTFFTNSADFPEIISLFPNCSVILSSIFKRGCNETKTGKPI